MWVITAHPSDAPGDYVARLHLTLPGPTEPMTNFGVAYCRATSLANRAAMEFISRVR